MQEMWPWGHLAVGYLCYVALLRVRTHGEQTLLTLAALVFGTQFPDLVDKPLAWTFGVLPSGRSFAHSLLTASIILLVLYRVSQRWRREEVVFVFGVGYVSHSLSDLGPDVIIGLLQGDWSKLQWTTYLLWPVLPVQENPHEGSIIQHFSKLVLDPYVNLQFGLLGLAIVIWLWSGVPGMATARQRLRAWVQRRG